MIDRRHTYVALRRILAATPFDGVQTRFSEATKLNLTVVNRLMLGRRHATPEIIGRLCHALPAADATLLLSAFLLDLAEEALGERGRLVPTVDVSIVPRPE